jgi:hypothetical protein
MDNPNEPDADEREHHEAFENQIVTAFRSIPAEAKGVAFMQVMALLKEFGGTAAGVWGTAGG